MKTLLAVLGATFILASLSACALEESDVEEDVKLADAQIAGGRILPAYGMNYGGLTTDQYHIEHLRAHNMALERAWWGLPLGMTDLSAFVCDQNTDLGRFVCMIDEQVRTAAKGHVSIVPIIFMVTQGGYTPLNREAWKSFVHNLVFRYGPVTHKGAGIFWRENSVPSFPIHAWEIWNEENTETFWYGAPSPTNYHDALAAAHASLRDVDPDARVIFGGLLGINNQQADALDFLAYVTNMNDGNCLFDAVAVHPYADDADEAVAKVRSTHTRLKRLGLTGKSAHTDVAIWITEVGWAVGGAWQNGQDTPFTARDDAAQAHFVSSFAAEMDDNRDAWRIGPTIWFNYQDLPKIDMSPVCDVTSGDWFDHTGFFALDSACKPTVARTSWQTATHKATQTRHVALPPVRCRKD